MDPTNPGSAVNANFNTGVENLPNHPALAAGSPRDGGFGSSDNCRADCGDGSFNTPPLVEAADTAPFFHNNAVQTTIEDAVDFYNSAQFNASPAAQPPFGTGPIQLEADEVQAVAAFLRVLNALENIRSAIQLGQRAEEAQRFGRVRELLRLAIAETNDAIKVLEERELHPGAVRHLRIARIFVEIASNIPLRLIRNIYIGLAIHEQKLARGRMVEG